MNKISDGLMTLTRLDESTVNKLLKYMGLLIGQYVTESDRDITEIDMGFGTLMVSTINNEIKTKFVPSQKLITDITNMLNGDNSALQKEINKALSTKFVSSLGGLI